MFRGTDAEGDQEIGQSASDSESKENNMTRFKGPVLAAIAFAFITTSGALARDKNHHSVVIPETLQVGSTQLAAGEYTMEWTENGSTAEVNFVQHGKSLAQVSAKIVNLSHPAESDSVTMTSSNHHTELLEQIQFGKYKEAFAFSDSPNGE
jgi:hypothetical protein